MLNSILWSQNITSKTKTLIYTSLVQSVIIHGAETRTLGQKQAKKLMAVEMEFWR